MECLSRKQVPSLAGGDFSFTCMRSWGSFHLFWVYCFKNLVVRWKDTTSLFRISSFCQGHCICFTNLTFVSQQAQGNWAALTGVCTAPVRPQGGAQGTYHPLRKFKRCWKGCNFSTVLPLMPAASWVICSRQHLSGYISLGSTWSRAAIPLVHCQFLIPRRLYSSPLWGQLTLTCGARLDL